MIIEKAIEGLEYEVKEAEGDGALDAVAYLRLGIEALQRCRDNYLNPQRADFRRLPSETKE